jgi:hypothetical protein
MTARSPQPGAEQRPGAGSDRDMPEQGRAQELISQVACLLNGTRYSALPGTGILSAIALGSALDAWSMPARRTGPAWVLCAGLLAGLALCWMASVIQLILARRPVLDALSACRWEIGAPLDPGAPWLVLPPGSADEERERMRARMFIGAARLREERVHRAQLLALAATAGLLVWTAALLLGL